MKSVLVAEVEEESYRIIQAVLTELKHQYLHASSGELAFDILSDNPSIDLLITDASLPGPAVKELIQMVRSKKELHDLPIIIVAKQMKISEVSDLLDIGASYFVPKPLQHDTIKAYIERILSRAK